MKSVEKNVLVGAAMGAAICVVGMAGRAEGAVFFGPSAYLSPADAPWAGTSFLSSGLENFEDGVFNLAGVTPSGEWYVPGGVLDSVDSDDGAINGTGATGRSFYSAGTQNTLTITFDAGVLGTLPTHAGIVWTDVGQVSSGSSGFGDVRFEAWGFGGAYLGEVTALQLGDGLISGQTAEDRFFGLTELTGISAIRISMPASRDWEVDHVQFGIVPAPAGVLVGLGALGMGARRRR